MLFVFLSKGVEPDACIPGVENYCAGLQLCLAHYLSLRVQYAMSAIRHLNLIAEPNPFLVRLVKTFPLRSKTRSDVDPTLLRPISRLFLVVPILFLSGLERALYRVQTALFFTFSYPSENRVHFYMSYGTRFKTSPLKTWVRLIHGQIRYL